MMLVDRDEYLQITFNQINNILNEPLENCQIEKKILAKNAVRRNSANLMLPYLFLKI